MNKYTKTYIDELQKTAGFGGGLLKMITPAIQGAYAAAKPVVSQAANELGSIASQNFQAAKPVVISALDKGVRSGVNAARSAYQTAKPVVEEAYHGAKPIVQDGLNSGIRRGMDLVRGGMQAAQPFIDSTKQYVKSL